MREHDLLTSNHGVFRYEDRATIMELAAAREAAFGAAGVAQIAK